MSTSRTFAAALLLCAATGHADPIHSIGRGAFQHHDSGWIFPQQLAGFARVGMPQDVEGSRDAVAYYARTVQGVRSTAAVEVYPNDSAVGPLTPAKAEAALEGNGSLAAAKKQRTHLQLRSQPALTAVRIAYRTDAGMTHLYFVASGEWIVQVRITSAKLAGAALDDFVRAQRWDSLGNALGD